MADRLFSTLVPRLNPSVPGCPQRTLQNAIRDSAIRTCERTLAWRYLHPNFDLLPGVHEYAYNKPVNADVHAVFEAVMNDDPLERLPMEEAIIRYPYWADLYSGQDPSVVWDLTPANPYNSFEYNEQVFNNNSTYVMPASIVADGGEPRFITQITPDKFIVLPLPDANKTYTMRMFMALKPKRSATGMDEVAFNELEDAIMHGALQDLLILPNVPWADRDLASYHAKQYTFHTTERRARANMGNVRGSFRARMQPFGN